MLKGCEYNITAAAACVDFRFAFIPYEIIYTISIWVNLNPTILVCYIWSEIVEIQVPYEL